MDEADDGGVPKVDADAQADAGNEPAAWDSPATAPTDPVSSGPSSAAPQNS